ncbi:hypothetical protein NSQ20_11795 [Paenibacillus sp. FSL K6-1122]|uniref:hypothetical protein n=1 Tax=Paenibacillus sp. FSL K6-1122 TaxID=2954512 RepID=UPI0030EB6C39
MELLTDSEKQLVLYSKGHFLKTNLTDDIKRIIAEGFEIPLESTQFYHVYSFVTTIFVKLHEKKYIDNSINDFLCGLFKWNDTLRPEDMIQNMMSSISSVKAVGLNLGKANSKYLTPKIRQT